MRKMKIKTIVLGLMLILALSACGEARIADPSEKPQSSPTEERGAANTAADDQTTGQTGTGTEMQSIEKTLHLYINDAEVAVEWENNESVSALIEMVSMKALTIQMSMYGGFEQVGSIGQSLPRNDVHTTASAGDIMLYSGNRIVVFYGPNSWAYTRLGKITDRSAEELESLLGSDNVTLTIAYGG